MNINSKSTKYWRIKLIKNQKNNSIERKKWKMNFLKNLFGIVIKPYKMDQL
jgi:hypothetical protein